jgi:AraC family transcriptional regulator
MPKQDLQPPPKNDTTVSQASFDAQRAVPGHKFACSVDAGWTSLLVRAFASSGEIPTFESLETPDQILTVGIGGRCHYESFLEGRWRSGLFHSGSGSMAPPGVVKRSRWRTEPGQIVQTAHLWIPQQLFLETEEEYRRAGSRYRSQSLNAFVFNDAVVAQSVFSLVKSIQMGAPNLYAESAAQFLAKHLLSMQSTWTEQEIERRRPEVLTDRRLTRVLVYMRENISNPISLHQLAREAGISRFHFVKRFRESLGITPHRYFVQLRMLDGATMLRNTDMTVSEIAIACGYATTAHFCAAFYDYHQQTALQYRQMARGGLISAAPFDGA